MNKGLTKEEILILNKITEIHNGFIDLAQTHPSDMHEWVTAVHELQKLLGLRVLRREHPDLYITLKTP